MKAYIDCEEVMTPNFHGILGKEWIRGRSSGGCRPTAMGGHNPCKSLRTSQLGTKWRQNISYQLSILLNVVGDHKVLIFIGDDYENMINWPLQ